jgi:quinolinate synthase
MPSVDTLVREVTIGRRRGAVCTDDLAKGPWLFDATPGYGPGCSGDDAIPPSAPHQGEIPERYRRLAPAELDERIAAAKTRLGSRLVILGHHYQRDEIVKWADFVGDSFKLARQAQTRPQAEFIVFCGVHFMAETADILSRPDQHVILPNLAAGCSMADMADLDSVTECWEQLETVLGPQPALPVTYMNSAADLKAFCGERGGIVCTSSNARRVLEWAFERSPRALFFPDQHLGRNTASAMGVAAEAMPLWDPRQPLGGNTADGLRQSRVVLWRGWCSVHKRFTPEQIIAARAEYPGIRILVHPEVPKEVADLADDIGSTEHIVAAVEAAPAGSIWGIATEVNLVRRLADAHPDQTIFCLDPVVCPCSTMYRIHPAYLAWVLESLVDGVVVNEIAVPSDVAAPARVALERMLSVP